MKNFGNSLKPCHFNPDYEHPDWETEKGKWWLCEKGEYCSIWRFDSTYKDYQAFLLLVNKTGQLLKEKYTISDISTEFDIYELILRESKKATEK